MSYELTRPSAVFRAITPSDSVDLVAAHGMPSPPRGIYVGGAGNLVAVDDAGAAVTFTGVAAGTTLPIRPDRINSTSTTATALVALY